MCRGYALRTLRPVEADAGVVDGAEVVLSLRHEPLTANAVAASLLQSKLSNVERITVLGALGAVYATNIADQDAAEALARTAGIAGRLGLQTMAKAVCSTLDVPPVAVRSGLKETGYARALATVPGGEALLSVQAEALAEALIEEFKSGPPSYNRAVATLELATVLSRVSERCERVLRAAVRVLESFIELSASSDGPSVA